MTDIRVKVDRREILAIDRLAIEQNEVLGLMGPNGAGKSTLLHVLAGLLKPSAGVVKIRATGGLSFLPERPQVPRFLTGREVLRFLSTLAGRKGADFDGAARKMGIENALDRPVRTYSKGMSQRLGLAQLWIEDSEVVLMDEPMSGLDPDGRRLVRSLIRELKSVGKTVIFSSHVESDFIETCDRVLKIDDGRIQSLTEIGALK